MAARKPLFLGTEGFSEEMALADTMTLGGLTIGSGGDITVSGGGELTGLPSTPTGDTAAASKAYVDSVAQGLDIHESVRAATVVAGTLATSFEDGELIDGVTLATGDRILIKDQASGVENGIYIVAVSGAPARADDWAIGYAAAGAFTFVEEGTANDNNGFVCTNDAGTDVTGTDALTFSQFSGAGQITAGTGLTKTGNTIDAIGGDGIVANANDLAVDLATNPGLQFTSNKLDLLLKSANELAKDASGLYVVGVPTLFKVGSTAVGATVTAPNFDTLTDGSNADALHVHASQPATEAPKVEDTMTTATDATTNGDPVYVNGNDTIGKALANTDAKARVIGVIRTGAGVAGSTPEVVSLGLCTGILSSATANTPYYLQAAGGIGTSLPGAANRVIQVGKAMNADDLFVQIIDYGKKAA